MKYKIKPSDKNLAFPRKVKVKKSIGRTPESALQAKVEEYLELKNLKYVRIPDEVYMLCNPFSRLGRSIPKWIAARIKNYLKAIPDLIILKGSGVLVLELKRRGRNLRQSQKKWLKGINHHVPVEFVECKVLIDDFDEKY